MEIYYDGEKVLHKINKSVSVMEMLRHLDLGRESVVVKVNGRLVTEHDSVRPGDRVELIRVSSGG